MLLALLVCSLVLVSAVGQQANDDWVDPYDMLHYDPTSKTMRKPTEPDHYDNEATKRRAYTEDPSQAELDSLKSQVVDLQKKIEEQKKNISVLSGQPTCNPVVKRFLTWLLNEMQKVGLPTDSSDAFYDAKVAVSKQAITDIQKLLDGDGNFTTGTLDAAIGHILVNLKPHDCEARKWRFEDSFRVELETLLMPAHFDNEATERGGYTEYSGQVKMVTDPSQEMVLQLKPDHYDNEPTERGGYTEYSGQVKMVTDPCQKMVLQLKPTDSSDALYYAKVGVSKQAITEIQALLDCDGNFTTGTLDTAVSQILVNLKPHDCEAWKWRFEDSFGVELDTLLMIGLCVLAAVAIISTPLWAIVSWLMRTFAVWLVVIFVWNLYHGRM